MLKELGLTDGEIKTYLAVLNLGPSSALDLSIATGLTRQSTYNATQRLSDLSLLDFSVRGNISVFSAKDPSCLINFAQSRQRNMDTLVKELSELVPELKMQSGGEKPSVSIPEGKEGLLEAMTVILQSGPGGGYELVDFEAVREKLADHAYEEMEQMVAKQGVRDVTAFFTDSAPDNMLEAVQKAYIIPGEDGGFKSVVCAFEKKIVLVSLRDKVHTIVIEDELLAGALRLLFKYAAIGLEQQK